VKVGLARLFDEIRVTNRVRQLHSPQRDICNLPAEPVDDEEI